MDVAQPQQVKLFSANPWIFSYLHRMERVTFPLNIAERQCLHTFLSAYEDDHMNLISRIGIFSSDAKSTDFGLMLQLEHNWGAIAVYIEKILRRKNSKG